MASTPRTRSIEPDSHGSASAVQIQGPLAHRWLIAIAVMLGTILEMIDSSIVNVALPHMQGSFSASMDEVTWVVTSYLVANGIMIPMTGWISARSGRKRYFLVSVAGFVASSAACGAARSLDQMVVFRLLQGLFGAAMQPSSQAILMETFPPEEQAMAMAMWGLGMMVAPIMGPTLGGWITDNWSWRWNFYINIPIGIAAFLMVSTFLSDPPYLRVTAVRKRRVDYPAIVLLVVGLGLLQLVLDRGQRADWFASPWVTYSTVIAAVSIASLIFWELKFPEPILDLQLFRIPTFSLATALTVVMFMSLYGVNFLNSLFLQEVVGYTALETGFVLAPRGIGAALAMLLIGQMARYRIRVKPMMFVGVAIQTIAIWHMMTWNLQVTYTAVMWPTILLSTGASLVFPVLSASTLACVQRERMGYAASLFGAVRNTGAAIGVSIMTTILVTHEQIHQSYLAEHFSVFNAWQMAGAHRRLPGAPVFLHFPDPMANNQHGLAMIYGRIQQEAAMLALNDIYARLLVLAAIVTPALMIIWTWQSLKQRPAGDGAPVAVH